MRDEFFEWDDGKARRNLADHGVGFELARLAFDDPGAVEREDDRYDYGEDRYSLVGRVREEILYVAFTLREDRIRIIMARHAEPFEKRLYHEQNT